MREPLPEVGALQRYRAVLTWFEAPLARATAYLDWGRKAAAAGARFVILGETGGNPFSGDLALVNTLIANIGLQHAGQVVGNTHGTRVVG